MKKYLLILVFLAIGFVACEKDDETETVKKNQVEYNGTSYEVAKGFIYMEQEYMDTGGGKYYACYIHLFTSGISYDLNNGHLRGSGDVFFLESVITSSANMTGSYTMKQNREIGSFGGFYMGTNLKDEKLTSATKEYFFRENGGNLVINKSGNNYEIIFSSSDDKGIPVKLYYNGPLEIKTHVDEGV